MNYRAKADENSNLTNANLKPSWAIKTGVINITPGTSVFDPVLCEVCYSWFCPTQGTILDPFAGGSVRGIVAVYLGLEYIGIDLSIEQIEENRRQAEEILSGVKPFWIVGNSLDIDTLFDIDKKVDFVFSCPPYFDLEVYSDNKYDLSTLLWEEFLTQYRTIIHKCLERLKENRFACFVVSDVRDTKGFYRHLPEKTVEIFTSFKSVHLYNNIVLINQAGSLPILVGRLFSSARKTGRMHQNILVFFKGDPKTIKHNFGVIHVADILSEDLILEEL